MGKLMLRLEAAARALSTLEEILHEKFSIIVRDAAIQRGENYWPLVWLMSLR
jgi:hypothetical protein